MISVPSRTSTLMSASSSSERATDTGTVPMPSMVHVSPGSVCPRMIAAWSTVSLTSTGRVGPPHTSATSASAA